MLKVTKFGGSSLADANQFAKVKAIIDSDPARKLVVVSAPGKRSGKDSKITDLLYLCYAHIKYGVDYHHVLDEIKDRYREIAASIAPGFDLDREFAEIDKKLSEGAGENYLVSRGEALCAKLMAAYLGWPCADDCIYLNYDGSIDYEKSNDAIRLAFSKYERMVVPGFFGILADESIGLMSRGGSDITGAACAAALDADIYENWTDVSGILMADPKIVDNPTPIAKITYDELHELSYMGAKVLHEASVYPVKLAGIPINIRNTNEPEAPGTIISDKFDDDDDKFYITGVAGKKGYIVIEVREDNMKAGTLGQALKIFEGRDIKPEQVTAGLDAFSIIIPGDTAKNALYSIAAGIESITGEGSVKITEGVSLIACVSRRMALKPGISGLIFGTLGENKINIRIITQGASELNIIIGVADADYERTVRVLCNSFME